MAYYDEFIELAVELIAETGRLVKVHLYDSTAADSTLPWDGPANPNSIDHADVMATFVPSGGSGLGKDIIREELLDRVDDVCMIAGFDKDISKHTKIEDEGTLKGIEWVQVLKPGDQIVLYFFGVKR